MKAKSHVYTYVKFGEDFIPFQQFNEKFPDPEYLDGAIDLMVEGVQLHGFDTWDYIDFLWSGIVRGMLMVVQGKAHREGFPDSSIDLVMTPVGNNRICIELDKLEDRNARVTVDQNEVFKMLCQEARSFICRMDERLPQHRDVNEPMSNDLDEIEAAIKAR